jgi:hypothetical protein
MSLRITLLFIILSLPIHLFAQENLKSTTIPAGLKENASAVVRLNQIDITISSQESMQIKKQRIVTVFNEQGKKYIGCSRIS